MCGILGYNGSFSSDLLNNALMNLSHRGRDDSGLFYDESIGVGFGHTRLSIQDLSSLGHQPMISQDNTTVLIFNGEIYNFRELREELESNGYLFRSNSDSEVILNLYLRDGVKMLSRLNGVFSLAVWDSNINSMLIARDGLGVKPLYYTNTEEGFSFASEIKALLVLSRSDMLNEQALYHYLSFLWCPGADTPLRHVKKVLPGEALVVKEGKIERRWSWYQLPAVRGIRYNLSSQDAIKGCEKYLRRAVHRQMVSDVPVGAFLSGGLDSSAVVAFAREINPNIRCFTIDSIGGQESGVVDDLPYAQKVAKYLDVPLDVITVDSDKLASGLENMVAMLDEPLADPAPLNVLYISQLARESGIKVLLSGAGGDDVFTGYRRHYAIQLDKWLRYLPLKIRSAIEKYSSSVSVNNPFFRRLSKLFNGTRLEGDDRIINYFRWADQDLIYSLFTAEVRHELSGVDVADPLHEYLSLLPDEASALERMLSLEQRFFLPDHNLTYTDKMSMAVGVEVRVPFLDLDLIEFAAKVPIKYKQRGSVGKWVLKKAMEPYLPNDVIYRPKTGFGAPLRRWIKFELRDLLNDLLSVESLNKRGIFDPVAVNQLIRNNEAGVVDVSYTLLSLMCIEIWCRQFIDRQFDYQKVYGRATFEPDRKI